jgi:thiol-disulfide isomerase/thioredoxin
MENGSVLAQFDVISKYFKNKKIRNHLYYDMLSAQIEFKDANTPFETALNAFNKLCTDDSLKMGIKELHTSKVLLAKGRTAPDFSFINSSTQKYTYSNFKGKAVLIDVWATWCGPCLREAPYWDSLKLKYKDAPIEFISISIDENKSAWEKYLAKKGNADHYLAPGAWDSELCKNYLIKGIPQFIFINAAGKIISSNAPLPSDPKLTRLIDEELKRNR